MRVIVVASAKGGAGKTTLACGLGVAAASQGKIALIDLDPIQAMTRWWELRGGAAGPRLVTGLDDLGEAITLLAADDWDLLIVDTPPAPLSVAFDAVALADIVLVPCRASPLDVEVVALTREMAQRHAKPYAFVVSQADAGSLTDETRAFLKTENGRVLRAGTSLSSDYPRAMIAGRMPEEMATSTVASEMRTVLNEALAPICAGAATPQSARTKAKRG